MRHFVRRKITVGFAFVTTLAWGAGLGVSVATAAPSCTESFDPYTVSAATLATCGLKSYPLEKRDIVASGPAKGASAFHYDIDGSAITSLVPPASFDPAVAPLEQLKAFGIPAEPSDSVGRAHWLHLVNNYHPIQPPDVLIVNPNVQIPTATNLSSNNWSAIVNTSTGPSPYTSSVAGWTEPVAQPTGCTQPSAAYWSGLGGVNSSYLEQSGTVQGVPGLADGQTWEEVLPAQPSLVSLPMVVAPGDVFATGTNYLGANKFAFAFYDYNTGGGYYTEAQNTGYNGHTSEFVAERPSYSGNLYGLLDFVNIAFYATQTNGVTSGNFPHDAYTMRNGTDVLAVPHSYVTSTGAFNAQWVACG